MKRVLTSLGMILVLVLTMESTDFTSNGYHKVHAAAVPTSDFTTKGAPGLSFGHVEITLYGFPGQNGNTARVVDIRPCEVPPEGAEATKCVGKNIGEGIKSLTAEVKVLHNHLYASADIELWNFILLPGAGGLVGIQTTEPYETKTIDVPGVQTGQARITFLP